MVGVDGSRVVVVEGGGGVVKRTWKKTRMGLAVRILLLLDPLVGKRTLLLPLLYPPAEAGHSNTSLLPLRLLVLWATDDTDRP